MKLTLEFRWGTALRLLVGLILVWASLGKLANLQEFFTALLAYRLPLPEIVLKLVAIILPWMELLCGLALLADRKSKAALAWAAVLFAAFAYASGQAWARGLPIACGCLDLSLVGLRPGSAAADFLESPTFACLRAVVLAAVAVGLLCRREKGSGGAA